MARAEHYRKGSTNAIIREHDRTAKELKNDVVRSRSHLNFGYGMAAEENTTAHDVFNRMMKRVDEIMGGRKMQDQTHPLGEWIITYPVDECDTVTEDLGQTDEKGRHILHKYHTPKDPEQMKRFFDECWRFVSDRYGADNMLGGWVHLDETTPQIHIDFVTETTSRKTGKKTVSAASLLSLYEKKNFQRDLEKDMEAVFHKKGMILNGKGKGDKTPEELREATAKKEAAERDAAEARQAEANARANEAAVRNQLTTLQNQIDDLKEQKETAEKNAAEWKAQAETDRKAAETAQKAAQHDYKADMENLKGQAQNWLKTAQKALTELQTKTDHMNDRRKLPEEVLMDYDYQISKILKAQPVHFKDGHTDNRYNVTYTPAAIEARRALGYDMDVVAAKQKEKAAGYATPAEVQEAADKVQQVMREVPQGFLDVTEKSDAIQLADDNQLDY